MSDGIHFIEVEPEKPCTYCGRKKLKESEKFHKVFLGDKDTGILVCELCKGGFLTLAVEGPEKTHATHLAFFVKHTFLKLKENLPETITTELDSAIENYQKGEYSTSFRSIGLVAEWLTESLFVRKFAEESTKETKEWETRLGRLLRASRENKKIPEETMIYQLFSLKWLRNRASHPSEYKITGDDVRLGLVSIMYLLQLANSYNLI
jgi:hypothetical protein